MTVGFIIYWILIFICAQYGRRNADVILLLKYMVDFKIFCLKYWQDTDLCLDFL